MAANTRREHRTHLCKPCRRARCSDSDDEPGEEVELQARRRWPRARSPAAGSQHPGGEGGLAASATGEVSEQAQEADSQRASEEAAVGSTERQEEKSLDASLDLFSMD